MPDNSPFNADQLKQLNAPLADSAIAQRKGPGGKMLNYVKGWYAIQKANEIFGFGQWGIKVISSEEVNRETCKISRKDGTEVDGWEVLYAATVALHVKDCIETQDVGYGSGKYEALGDAIELARKESVTDAMKRALRQYGDQFGNGLYDADDIESHVAVDADAIVESARALKELPEITGGSDSQRPFAERVRKALLEPYLARYGYYDGLRQQLDGYPDIPGQRIAFAALCVESDARFWLDGLKCQACGGTGGDDCPHCNKYGSMKLPSKTYSDDAIDPEIAFMGRMNAKLKALGFDAEPEREPGDESEVNAEDINF